MNYLIDIAILFFISLFTFIGYKKGLIKIAFKLVSFILAIAISIALYKPLSSFIINYTTLDDSISQTISERLSSSTTSKEETNSIISNYYKEFQNSSITIISNSISNTIINISCIIIVFLISNIILLFFKFSGDLISKLPLIKQVNHIGGFIYGLLKGFVFVYLFFAILTIIAPITDISNFIKLINSSIIANIMYNNNIILILFT